jgi:hypothetical protein
MIGSTCWAFSEAAGRSEIRSYSSQKLRKDSLSVSLLLRRLQRVTPINLNHDLFSHRIASSIAVIVAGTLWRTGYPSRKWKQRLSSLNARSPHFPESVSTWPQTPATVVETFDLTQTLSGCSNPRKSPPCWITHTPPSVAQ